STALNTNSSQTNPNTINLGASSGLQTGDQVVFHINGGTFGDGLLDGQKYYVRNVGGGLYKFYNSADDAKNNANAILLIGPKPNETQQFPTAAGATDPNNKQAEKNPPAKTADGAVDVAAAVAVNIENGSSIASIPDGRTITSDGGQVKV